MAVYTKTDNYNSQPKMKRNHTRMRVCAIFLAPERITRQWRNCNEQLHFFLTHPFLPEFMFKNISKEEQSRTNEYEKLYEPNCNPFWFFIFFPFLLLTYLCCVSDLGANEMSIVILEQLYLPAFSGSSCLKINVSLGCSINSLINKEKVATIIGFKTWFP